MIESAGEPDALKPRNGRSTRLFQRRTAGQQLDRRVLNRGYAGQEMKRLVDETELAALIVSRAAYRQRSEILPPKRITPASGASSAAASINNVLFPEPLGP